MGTFIGHILPGTFFFIYGFFYIVRSAFNSALPTKKKVRPALSPSRHKYGGGGAASSSSGDLVEGGNPGTEGWISLENDEEETLLYTSSTPSTDDGNLATTSNKKIAAHDDVTQSSDSLQHKSHDGNDIRGEAPREIRKCARCREWATNISVIEGVLKIVCSTIGAIGELWWVNFYMVNPRTGNFTNMNNWQHATMFMFFGVSGVADIVFQTCLKPTSSSPSNIAKIFLSLAFWVEGLLFYFHTHGREELDVRIHTLLVVAIFVCAAASGLEPWFHHASSAGVRHLWVIATCVQGTWFWQIAFLLYNPWKDGESEPVDEVNEMHTIMMMTTMFTWHILAVLLITVLVHLIVRPCSKQRCHRN